MNKLLLLLLLAASTYCRAQVTGYTFASRAANFTELSGSTVVSSVLGDSGKSAPIIIGFDFLFSNSYYNKVVATSDGFLSFNTAATSVAANNLTAGSPALRPLLAPLWDDLAGASGYSQFSYLSTGTVGSRIFTAEWKRWLWNWQSGGSPVSFQIKLYEGTNKIEYWYRPEGYSVTNGSASVGMADVGTGSGNFLSLSNLWRTPVASFTTETNSISTRPDSARVYTFTPPPITVTDVAIKDVSLRSGSICPAAALPLSLTIINSGGTTIDFANTSAVISVNITGPLPQTLSTTLTNGVLVPGAQQTVTLSPTANFTTNGTYNLRWGVDVPGDNSHGNDTLRTTTATATTAAPWAERFNTTALPFGWKAPNWSIQEFLGVYTTGNPGSGITKSFASAASDTASCTTLSVGPISATDRLSFDYKLFTPNTVSSLPAPGWGSFKVQVSTDCGSNYNTIDSVTDAVAVEGWDFRSYALAAYAGQHITLRIVPRWKTGNFTMAFDNFKIKTPAAVDLATAGTRPVLATCPNNNTPVQVLVRNDGTDPVDFASTNASLISEISTGLTTTQTLSATLNSGILAPGASQWMTVATNGNFASSNTYKFKSYIITATDGDRTNDTSSNNFTSYTTIISTPWNEPFATTTLPTGWSIGDWNVGTTYMTGNPGNCINKPFYASNAGGSIYTGPMGPISTGQYLKLDYKLINILSPYVVPAPGWGKISILIKRNCGGSYLPIDSITTATEGWNSKLIDLSAWAGDYISLYIAVTYTTGSWYLGFDNFRIYTPPAVDLAATQITVPAGRCPNPAAPIGVSFKNLGTSTIDFASTPATVTVHVTSPAPQTFTATLNSGTLSSLSSQTITVAPSANLSVAGNYSLKGFVAVSGDTTRSNDTAATTAFIAAVINKPAPWVEAFNTGPNIPDGWDAYGWAVGGPRGISGNPGNSLYQQINGNYSSNSINTVTVGLLPANSSFSFDYKIATPNPPYTAITGNFGSIVVSLSADCGATFTTLETITTAASGWSTKTYSLAAYAGKQVSINLLTYGTYAAAQDFGYDNFRIYTLQPADLSLETVYATDNFCPSASVQSYLLVKNNGPGTIDFANTPVNATLQITGPIPQTLNASLASGSLAPNGTGGILFPTFANLSAIGTYQYKGYISLMTDSNRVNDTLYLTRTTGTASPWVEPFTDTVASPMVLPNGWLIGATRGATGNPANNIYYNLRSDTFRTFSTRAIGPITSQDYLRFDYKLSNTSIPYDPPTAGWGYFKVQVSTNCGSTFTTLDSVTTAPAGWATKTYPLSAYAGQNVRLQIEPRWKAGDYDLAFDNLKISNATPCPAPTSGYTDQRTDSSARVNFTGNGNNFIIEYGPYGFAPGTGASAGTGGIVVMATGTPVTINGLAASTGYKFYARQNCPAANDGYSTNRLIDSFTTPAAPLVAMTNDLPANAITINVGGGCNGSRYTINGATQSNGEPAVSCSGSLSGGKIVWFKFAAPASGFVKISTDAVSNTLADTKAALFSATDSSNFSTFQIIACDDDNGVIQNTASLFYATGLTPGRNYYVAVDGFNAADTGRFCIQVAAADSSMIATSGSCISGQQLPEHLPAYRGWLSATDYNGKLIANLRSNIAMPDKVTYYSFVNINTDSVRQAATSEYYLDRNFSIINNFPTTAGNWDVQFFFLNKELRTLQAVGPGTTLASLNVTRGKDSLCRAAFLSGSADSLLLQSASGTTSGVSWVTVPTSRLASFYLNPGSSPLPRLYVFTGNGNWSDPANWSNNTVPPAMLPPNSVVEIRPAPSGQCILDVNQHITNGDRLRIRSGTNVVIPGSVIIQQ